MTQKSIFITGSSSGFGYDAAIALAERGHTVFATMRGVDGKNREAALGLTELAEKHDWKLHVLELDVTDQDSIDSAVETAIAEAGRIDTLVNNAGVGNAGLQEAFTIDQAQWLFDVNVFGVLRLNRAVLPHMREAGSGHVIYISSGLGRFVLPFMGIYTSSKWALEALAESASYELAPLGIDTTIVEPGAFGTPFGANVIRADEADRLAGAYGEVQGMFEAFFGGFEAEVEAGNTGDPAYLRDKLVALIEAAPEDRPIRLPVGDDVEEGLAGINAVSVQLQEAIMEHFGAGALT